jgi:hypothetical protein
MSLVDLMAELKDEIRTLSPEEFKEKHKRLFLLKGKTEELYEMYKAHPWLNYAAQGVICPEFNKLEEYITSMSIHPTDYRLPPKRDYLPNSPYVYRTRFIVSKFPEYQEAIGSHSVSVDIRSDLDIGVSPSNWTSIEFIPWYEGYGLLIIHTDVCSQGWLGFCSKDSILDVVRRVR